MIGPNTQVVLHDHRDGETCNARCIEVPKAGREVPRDDGVPDRRISFKHSGKCADPTCGCNDEDWE